MSGLGCSEMGRKTVCFKPVWPHVLIAAILLAYVTDAADVALSLDGSQSYVSYDGITLAQEDEISISAWVWRPSNPPQSQRNTLISLTAPSLGFTLTVGWDSLADGTSSIYYEDSRKGLTTGASGIPTDQWVNVVLTVSQTGLGAAGELLNSNLDTAWVKVWVNGKVVTHSMTLLPQATASTQWNLLIGARQSISLIDFLYGRLDELRVFPRALSEAEVACQPFTAAPTDTVLYLNFNDFDPTVSPIVHDAYSPATKTAQVSFAGQLSNIAGPWSSITVAAITKLTDDVASTYYHNAAFNYLGGTVVTIDGTGFYDSAFLEVKLAGLKAQITAVTDTQITAIMPSVVDDSWDGINNAAELVVSNGGCNSFNQLRRLQYAPSHDILPGLLAYFDFNFEGQSSGSSGAHIDDALAWDTDRNALSGHPDAVMLAHGSSPLTVLALPKLSGPFSICGWVRVTAASTLFSQVLQPAAAGEPGATINKVAIDAHGQVLVDDIPVPGATIFLYAWQLLCVSRNATHADVSVMSSWVGSAAIPSVPTQAALSSTLIGTGDFVLDDLWIFQRSLKAYEPGFLLRTPDSIEFDGSTPVWLNLEGIGAGTGGVPPFLALDQFLVDMMIYPYTPGAPAMATVLSITDASNAPAFSVSIVSGRIQLQMLQADTTIKTMVTTNAVVPSRWMRLTVAKPSNSALLQVYLDGVAVVLDSGAVSPAVLGANYHLAIGRDLGSADVFHGLVGRVSIYQMLAGFPTFPAGLDCAPATGPGMVTNIITFVPHPGNDRIVKDDSPLQYIFRVMLGSAAMPSGMKPMYGSSFLTTWSNVVPVKNADFGKSSLYGSAAGDAITGWTGVLQSRDSCGALTTLPLTLVQASVTNADPALPATASATDVGETLWAIRVVGNACGANYQLTVQQSGGSATKQKTITLLAGPGDGAMSYVVDDDCSAADNLEEARWWAVNSFKVLAVDKFGCPRTKGGDSLVVELRDQLGVFNSTSYYPSPPASGVPPPPQPSSLLGYTDNQDGSYTVHYVPTAAGGKQLAVYINGMQLTGRAKVDGSSCLERAATTLSAPVTCINSTCGPGALSFSGAGSVTVPDAPQLRLATTSFCDWTLSLWVNPHGPVQDPTGTAPATLASKMDATGGWGLYISSGNLHGNLTATIVTADGEVRTVSHCEQELPAYFWTHVTVQYQGCTGLTLMVNGTVVDQQSWGVAKPAGANSANLVIGDKFTGLIDEVKILRTGNWLQDAPSAAMCPNDDFVAYDPYSRTGSDIWIAFFSFNEGAGPTVTDLSRDHAVGTLAGDAAFTDDTAPSLMGRTSDTSGTPFGLKNFGDNPTNWSVVDNCGLPLFLREYNIKVNGGMATFQVESETGRHDDGHVYPYVVTKKYRSDFETRVATGMRGDPSTTELVVDMCMGVTSILADTTPPECGMAVTDLELRYCSPSWHLGAPDHTTNFSVVSFRHPDPDEDGISAKFSTVTGLTGGAQPGIPQTFTILPLSATNCAVKRNLRPLAYDVQLTRVAAQTGQSIQAGDMYSKALRPDTVNVNTGYSFSFTVPSCGQYVLDVTYEGRHLPGSPFPITADCPPLNTGRCTGDEGQMSVSFKNTNGAVYTFTKGSNSNGLELGVSLPTDQQLNGFQFQRTVTATAASPARAVRVVVDTAAAVAAGKMRPDCSDVVFRQDVSTPDLPYWLEPLPGCNSTTTAFWLPTPLPSLNLVMLYGRTTNAFTPTPQADPALLFPLYDDFGGYGSNDDLLQAWNLQDSCSCQPGSRDAFQLGSFLSSGDAAMQVLAQQRGGSVSRPVSPSLTSYIMRAAFYDTNEKECSHWIAPQIQQCSYTCGKYKLPGGFGLGVHSGANDSFYALSSPFHATQHERAGGWHTFEVVVDGTSASVTIDNDEPITFPVEDPAPLEAIFIRGGGGPVANNYGCGAWWDDILVAQYDPNVKLLLGSETRANWEPPSLPFDAPAAAYQASAYISCADKLWLVGSSNEVYVYDPAAPTQNLGGAFLGSLPVGDSAPIPRKHQALACDGSTVYMFGGAVAGQLLNDLWSLDTRTSTWECLGNCSSAAVPLPWPRARSGHSMSAFDGKLYIFGGAVRGAVQTSETWEWDTSSGTWQELQTRIAPPPRSGHSSWTADGAMHVYGGRSFGTKLQDGWKLDMVMGQWTQLAGDEYASTALPLIQQCGQSLFYGTSQDSTFIDLGEGHVRTPSFFPADRTCGMGPP